VVKLSRLGRRAHLDREKKALSILQGIDGVVQRIGDGDEGEISLCVQKVPVLILSPKGLSFQGGGEPIRS
jgi:hypothetical protein